MTQEDCLPFNIISVNRGNVGNERAKRFDCHNKLQYISYVMHIIAYAEFISPEILWYLANSKNEFSHHKHSVRKKKN